MEQQLGLDDSVDGGSMLLATPWATVVFDQVDFTCPVGGIDC